MNAERLEQKRLNRQKTPARRVHETIDWAMTNVSWLPAVLGSVSVLVSGYFFAVAQNKDGTYNPGFIFLGLLFGGVSILTQVLLDRWRRQSEQGKTYEAGQLNLAITDAIQPIVRELAKMNNLPSTKRQQSLEKIVGLASTAVRVLFPRASRARIVVYRIQPARGVVKARLVADHYAGRKDKPRSFVAGDGGRGDAVHDWLIYGDTIFVADVLSWDAPGASKTGRGYRTFVASRIVSEDNAFGMLCIDAPVPGDLDETDVPLVEILSDLLAAAYVAAARK